MFTQSGSMQRYSLTNNENERKTPSQTGSHVFNLGSQKLRSQQGEATLQGSQTLNSSLLTQGSQGRLLGSQGSQGRLLGSSQGSQGRLLGPSQGSQGRLLGSQVNQASQGRLASVTLPNFLPGEPSSDPISQTPGSQTNQTPGSQNENAGAGGAVPKLRPLSINDGEPTKLGPSSLDDPNKRDTSGTPTSGAQNPNGARATANDLSEAPVAEKVAKYESLKPRTEAPRELAAPPVPEGGEVTPGPTTPATEKADVSSAEQEESVKAPTPAAKVQPALRDNASPSPGKRAANKVTNVSVSTRSKSGSSSPSVGKQKKVAGSPGVPPKMGTRPKKAAGLHLGRVPGVVGDKPGLAKNRSVSRLKSPESGAGESSSSKARQKSPATTAERTSGRNSERTSARNKSPPAIERKSGSRISGRSKSPTALGKSSGGEKAQPRPKSLAPSAGKSGSPSSRSASGSPTPKAVKSRPRTLTARLMDATASSAKRGDKGSGPSEKKPPSTRTKTPTKPGLETPTRARLETPTRVRSATPTQAKHEAPTRARDTPAKGKHPSGLPKNSRKKEAYLPSHRTSAILTNTAKAIPTNVELSEEQKAASDEAKAYIDTLLKEARGTRVIERQMSQAVEKRLPSAEKRVSDQRMSSAEKRASMNEKLLMYALESAEKRASLAKAQDAWKEKRMSSLDRQMSSADKRLSRGMSRQQSFADKGLSRAMSSVNDRVSRQVRGSAAEVMIEDVIDRPSMAEWNPSSFRGDSIEVLDDGGADTRSSNKISKGRSSRGSIRASNRRSQNVDNLFRSNPHETADFSNWLSDAASHVTDMQKFIEGACTALSIASENFVEHDRTHANETDVYEAVMSLREEIKNVTEGFKTDLYRAFENAYVQARTRSTSPIAGLSSGPAGARGMYTSGMTESDVMSLDYRNKLSRNTSSSVEDLTKKLAATQELAIQKWTEQFREKLQESWHQEIKRNPGRNSGSRNPSQGSPIRSGSPTSPKSPFGLQNMAFQAAQSWQAWGDDVAPSQDNQNSRVWSDELICAPDEEFSQAVEARAVGNTLELMNRDLGGGVSHTTTSPGASVTGITKVGTVLVQKPTQPVGKPFALRNTVAYPNYPVSGTSGCPGSNALVSLQNAVTNATCPPKALPSGYYTPSPPPPTLGPPPPAIDWDIHQQKCMSSSTPSMPTVSALPSPVSLEKTSQVTIPQVVITSKNTVETRSQGSPSPVPSLKRKSVVDTALHRTIGIDGVSIDKSPLLHSRQDGPILAPTPTLNKVEIVSPLPKARPPSTTSQPQINPQMNLQGINVPILHGMSELRNSGATHPATAGIPNRGPSVAEYGIHRDVVVPQTRIRRGSILDTTRLEGPALEQKFEFTGALGNILNDGVKAPQLPQHDYEIHGKSHIQSAHIQSAPPVLPTSVTNYVEQTKDVTRKSLHRDVKAPSLSPSPALDRKIDPYEPILDKNQLKPAYTPKLIDPTQVVSPVPTAHETAYIDSALHRNMQRPSVSHTPLLQKNLKASGPFLEEVNLSPTSIQRVSEQTQPRRSRNSIVDNPLHRNMGSLQRANSPLLSQPVGARGPILETVTLSRESIQKVANTVGAFQQKQITEYTGAFGDIMKGRAISPAVINRPQSPVLPEVGLNRESIERVSQRTQKFRISREPSPVIIRQAVESVGRDGIAVTHKVDMVVESNNGHLTSVTPTIQQPQLPGKPVNTKGLLLNANLSKPPALSTSSYDPATTTSGNALTSPPHISDQYIQQELAKLRQNQETNQAKRTDLSGTNSSTTTVQPSQTPPAAAVPYKITDEYKPAPAGKFFKQNMMPQSPITTMPVQPVSPAKPEVHSSNKPPLENQDQTSALTNYPHELSKLHYTSPRPFDLSSSSGGNPGAVNPASATIKPFDGPTIGPEGIIPALSAPPANMILNPGLAKLRMKVESYPLPYQEVVVRYKHYGIKSVDGTREDIPEGVLMPPPINAMTGSFRSAPRSRSPTPEDKSAALGIEVKFGSTHTQSVYVPDGSQPSATYTQPLAQGRQGTTHAQSLADGQEAPSTDKAWMNQRVPTTFQGGNRASLTSDDPGDNSDAAFQSFERSDTSHFSPVGTNSLSAPFAIKRINSDMIMLPSKAAEAKEAVPSISPMGGRVTFKQKGHFQEGRRTQTTASNAVRSNPVNAWRNNKRETSPSPAPLSPAGVARIDQFRRSFTRSASQGFEKVANVNPLMREANAKAREANAKGLLGGLRENVANSRASAAQSTPAESAAEIDPDRLEGVEEDTAAVLEASEGATQSHIEKMKNHRLGEML